MHQVIYVVYFSFNDGSDAELLQACVSEEEANQFIEIDCEVNETEPGDYSIVKYRLEND